MEGNPYSGENIKEQETTRLVGKKIQSYGIDQANSHSELKCQTTAGKTGSVEYTAYKAIYTPICTVIGFATLEKM